MAEQVNGYRRKDVGMKMIYAVLAILVSAFAAITLGAAQEANKKTDKNTTEIAVVKNTVEKNQDLIVEKIDSILAQQTLIFGSIKEDIREIKTRINN